MKTFILSILALLSLSTPISSAETLGKSDLDLQITLENYYTNKIKQAYPEMRFMVTVDLFPRAVIELDVLGGKTQFFDQDESVISRVKGVDIAADEPLDLKNISTLIRVPVKNLKALKVVFPKKSPLAMSYVEETEKKTDWLPIGSYILLSILSLVGIVGLFLIRKSIGGIIEQLSKGIQNTSQSMPEARVEVAQSQERHSQHHTSPGVHTQEYTSIQLKAFFSECYWSKHDAEASALVRAFPKPEVYQELRFGAEYLNYLKNIKPGSLTFMTDPYFLSPNPVFFDLSVDDTPEFSIPMASQLRFDTKDMGAVELLKVQHEPTSFTLKAIKSQTRELKATLRVRFRDVAEEDFVIKSTEIPEAVKIQLPSLYRLQKLSSKSFDQVIAKVTVNELAQAWIGPPSVLFAIETRIPERKRELLKEVVKKTAPDRNGQAFQKIMDLCDAELEQPQSEEKQAA